MPVTLLKRSDGRVISVVSKVGEVIDTSTMEEIEPTDEDLNAYTHDQLEIFYNESTYNHIAFKKKMSKKMYVKLMVDHWSEIMKSFNAMPEEDEDEEKSVQEPPTATEPEHYDIYTNESPSKPDTKSNTPCSSADKLSSVAPTPTPTASSVTLRFNHDGDIFHFTVEGSNSVDFVKAKVVEKIGGTGDVRLWYRGRYLVDTNIVSDCISDPSVLIHVFTTPVKITSDGDEATPPEDETTDDTETNDIRGSVIDLKVQDLTQRIETITVVPTDDVSVLRALISAKWDQPRHIIRLMYNGEILEDKQTIAEAQIDPTVPVIMILRLRGGAKRARDTKTKSGNKEDLIIDLTFNLQQLSHFTGDVSGIPAFASASKKINEFIESVDSNPVAFQALLNNMPYQTVVRLRRVIDGTNAEYKMAQITTIIFQTYLDQFRAIDVKGGKLKESMEVCVKLMLLQCYGSDEGTIQWSTMKDYLDTLRSNMDRAAGAKSSQQE
jgi:hypothetical protein